MNRKKLLLVLLATCLALSSPAIAATVLTTWTPNTESDLAGYRLYSSTDENLFVRLVDNPSQNSQCGEDIIKSGGEEVGEHPCTVSDTGELFWFAVTAFDTTGNESGLSNKVSYQTEDKISPIPPKQFQLRVEMAQRADGSQEMKLVLYPLNESN